jgi:hypothetical protein
VHNRTDIRPQTCHDGRAPWDRSPWREHMLLITIIVVLIAVLAVLVIVRRRTLGGGNTDLGWVSEQWLAEYRASHPS